MSFNLTYRLLFTYRPRRMIHAAEDELVTIVESTWITEEARSLVMQGGVGEEILPKDNTER